MSPGSFAGLRVLSLESRRRQEMQVLIEKHGGRPTVVESLREVPQQSALHVATYADGLEHGAAGTLVCMTGVGTKMFLRDLVRDHPHVLPLLKGTRIVARGPKPQQALKEFGLTGELVGRPHTWHEVLDHLLATSRIGEHFTLLEFGEPAPAPMLAALAEVGMTVESIPVYRCVLPRDLAPLEGAVRDTAAYGFDVLLLSSGTQIVHFVRVARDLGLETEVREALRLMVVASIGPACSEAVGDLRLRVDLEANPHKMGMLVRTAAEHAEALLVRKGRLSPIAG